MHLLLRRIANLCYLIRSQLLEKVEGIKKAGVPTKEASRLLQRMEEKLKLYRRFWEDDQRYNCGLFIFRPAEDQNSALIRMSIDVLR